MSSVLLAKPPEKIVIANDIRCRLTAAFVLMLKRYTDKDEIEIKVQTSSESAGIDLIPNSKDEWHNSSAVIRVSATGEKAFASLNATILASLRSGWNSDEQVNAPFNSEA